MSCLLWGCSKGLGVRGGEVGADVTHSKHLSKDGHHCYCCCTPKERKKLYNVHIVHCYCCTQKYLPLPMTLGMMTTSMELMQIMITMVKSLCMDGPG